VTLHGKCEDCGRLAPLRYKPDPVTNESRPSVCDRCREQREFMLEEQMRDERPVPHHIPPVPEDGGDDD